MKIMFLYDIGKITKIGIDYRRIVQIEIQIKFF